MNTPSPALVFIFSLVILAPAGAQPTRRWSQGDPTPEEQQALEWLNASRRDPAGTLTAALASADAVTAGFLLAEAPAGPAPLEQWAGACLQTAIADSAAFSRSEAISQAPLALYPLFEQEAASLGSGAAAPPLNFPPLRQPPAYIYPVPLFNDALLAGPSAVLTGPDATGGSAQFGPYGANPVEVSQANLYASYITPREWMLTRIIASYPDGTWSPPPSFLLQGDSLPNLTLGHTRLIGIAVSPGQSGGRILTTASGSVEFFTRGDLPFGISTTVFITGVAFQDANSNGLYDPGEGIAGLTIAPDRGDWYAITSASGGYAIPVAANSGAYALTATDGAGRSATATVVVGTDSVKADWTWPSAPPTLPAQVPVAPSDGNARVAGFSTRGLVQQGENALIGGFVISGPPGSTKKVLIRGVGPSLQTVGFPADECLPATQIELVSGGQAIAANQGWSSVPDAGAAVAQAAAQVGDFPLLNWAGGGGDSALVADLAPGSYTVLVSPATGTAAPFLSGRVGLVEIYDLDAPNAASRLVNLSTRALAGPGDQRPIIGWTVAGSGHDRLLIRGSGPALAATFGLPGTLPNPTVALFDGVSQPLAFDDDWGSSPQTAQIAALASAAGAFAWAAGSADAALVTLAPAGNFSAAVGASAGTAGSGVALIEIYETP